MATEKENGMDVVFALADRISELNKGIVPENSALEEIRSSAAVREAHLGSQLTARARPDPRGASSMGL